MPRFDRRVELYDPTGISPVAYVIKLWTPKFQRRKSCGYRSPIPNTASPKLSERENGNSIPPGPCSAPFSVPLSEVLLRPNKPIRPTDACPPNTGVGSV